MDQVADAALVVAEAAVAASLITITLRSDLRKAVTSQGNPKTKGSAQ